MEMLLTKLALVCNQSVVKIMSKKKWTKEPKAVEKQIRNIIVSSELKSSIEEEIPKMKIITPTIISGKYNIRVSVANEIIKDLEKRGKIKLVEGNPRIKIYQPVLKEEKEIVEKVKEAEKVEKAKKKRK